MIDWVISGCHPFTIVEEPKFREMMITCDSNFKNISHNTVKESVRERTLKTRAKLVSKIGDYPVSLTCDNCTSMGKNNYTGMTAHWIDGDYKLNSIPIGCFLHQGDTKS